MPNATGPTFGLERSEPEKSQRGVPRVVEVFYFETDNHRRLTETIVASHRAFETVAKTFNRGKKSSRFVRGESTTSLPYHGDCTDLIAVFPPRVFRYRYRVVDTSVALPSLSLFFF